MTDGQQIREWRWAIGLTQVAMGRKLGCTGRQVRRYELGDTPVPKLVYDAVKKLFDDKCKGKNQ